MTAATIITVGGVQLETRRWPGSGLPILLLHEGLGSVAMWRDFLTSMAVATGRPVIAWSRQGYGVSDRLQAPRDPDYMHREAALLPAVMDALEVERAHLFGHSDGGSIALIAAAMAPDRIASLILEAPHVYVERTTLESIGRIGAAYATSDLGRKLGRYHADADRTFHQWNDIWLDPRFRDWNIEPLLPAVRAPSLLIQGCDDKYGTMDQLDRIGAAIPGARRIELDRCGHSPHRDRPEAVLAAVCDFLEQVDHRVADAGLAR